MNNFVNTALKEYLTHEVLGVVNNPRIMQYSKDIGLAGVPNDELPWCAIFISWCLMQSKNTYGPWCAVDQFLNYGLPTTTPELGDLVIFMPDKNPGAVSHIAIFVKIADGFIYFLGGNQNDEVNIMKLPATWPTMYRKIPVVAPACYQP